MRRSVWLSGLAKSRSASARTPRTAVPLRLESMEERLSPTDIFWTNQGGDNKVSTLANWNPNEIPDIFDTMTFPVLGSPTNTVNVDITFGAQSMTILSKGYTFITPAAPNDEVIGIDGDGGVVATYGAGGTSTLNVPLSFFFADNPSITTTNQDSKLVLNGFNGVAVSTAPGETLTFDGSGDTFVNGRIESGFFGESRDVYKEGTGTLTFAAGTSNAYGGTTFVRDGKLVLNATSGTNAIPGSLVIGDDVGKAGSASVVQSKTNQIVNTSNVSIASDGLWDLTALSGAAEQIGGLKSATAAAQVNLGAAGLSLNPGSAARYFGSVTATSGTVTVLASDQTFAGPMTFDSGTGVTVTNGATLEAQNTVSGAGGFLNTTSNGPTSEKLFNSGASVGVNVFGNDEYFPAIRDTDGNVTPAVPLTGTLNLATTSKTTMQIDAPSSFSGITVTGSVTNLGVLRVKLGTNYVPLSAESFVIIDKFSDGGIGTEFANLSEGDTFFDVDNKTQFKITYLGGDGNDVVITNTNAPTVTLNQASTQADPTSGTTASFDAVFSGSVKSFDVSKVSVGLSGTLKSTGVSFLERSPTIYRVTVTGLTGTGTVTMNLQPGAGTSFADVPSLASTSTDNSVTVIASTSGGGGGGGGGVVGPVAPGNGATNPGSGNVLLVGTGAGDNRVNAYRGAATDFTQSRVTGAEFSGGVRVATADFNGDGFEDYVLGSGPGGPSTVRILDGRTGATLFNATPFELSFTGGVYVAAGDLNGDKTADLVVTADVGGGPRVLVYSGVGFKQVGDFFGIDDPNFRGGARPAIGDINNDGIGDLVIAAGFGGGPRIAGYVGPSVFGASGTNPPTKAFLDFFAFEPSLTNGVFVAVGDVNGDGFGDVIAGGGPGGGPRVSAFSGEQLIAGVRSTIANFFAGDPANRGGIRLTVEDFQGDGIDDLITGSGDAAGTKVTVYPLNTLGSSGTPPVLTAFDAFPDLLNGVFVG